MASHEIHTKFTRMADTVFETYHGEYLQLAQEIKDKLLSVQTPSNNDGIHFLYKSQTKKYST
jgi:hypothetical protein